jgi:hypothetical protein
MKLNFLSIVNRRQKGVIKFKRGILNDQELAIYQREKIERDIKFFESAVPYLSGFSICLIGSLLVFAVYGKYYEKKYGHKLSKKIMFELIDVKESEVKN